MDMVLIVLSGTDAVADLGGGGGGPRGSLPALVESKKEPLVV